MMARSNLATLFLLLTTLALAQQTLPPCSHCAEWNAPQPPFRIYGNTYYVGPHGLSSILITSDKGHVLIDGALPESVSQITHNVRSLGFRIEDIKLIVNSHVHFDHAGGIAELQCLSGARVVASRWSADVLAKTGIGRGDPQFAITRPIALVKNVETLSDGESFEVGPIHLTAHLTPGHTPGGTSWTWQSCEGGRCVNLVYADSLTPVSADGFKFTRNSENPDAIQDFKKSFAFLRSTPCDILISTHPDTSGLWDRLAAREKGAKPDPMIDGSACRKYALNAEESLQERVAAEQSK